MLSRYKYRDRKLGFRGEKLRYLFFRMFVTKKNIPLESRQSAGSNQFQSFGNYQKYAQTW